MQPGEENLRSGGTWLAGEAFYGLVSGFRRSLFRFQVHQTYGVPWHEAEFQQFVATGRREIDPADAYLVLLRDAAAAGRRVQRVQVVHRPLSDYLRYSFVYFRESVKAGEDLRILDSQLVGTAGLPDHDFFLIDDETVIKMHYSIENGTYLGRELLLDADLAEYRAYRDCALAGSTAFLEYEE